MRNWGVVISGFYVLAVATLSPVVMALIRSIDDTGAMSRLPNAYSAEWYAWAWIAVAGSRSRSPMRQSTTVQTTQAVGQLASAIQTSPSAQSSPWSITRMLVTATRTSSERASPAAAADTATCRRNLSRLRSISAWTRSRTSGPSASTAGSSGAARWSFWSWFPAYLIVRQRHECTAPEVTAFGVATGLAILLMSVGPGTWFLYRAGLRRLRGGPDPRPHG
jgi:hypothetical protein